MRVNWSTWAFFRSVKSEIALAKLGFKASDVKYVIYSHFHLDHAGTDGAATTLIVNGAAVSHRGLLETTADTDTFAFTTAGGPVALQIGALVNPAVLSNKTSLDVVAELRDASGTVIARSDPPDSPSASFSTTLPAGTYRLRVAGTGVATPLANQPNGYTAYGSIGAFAITGTVPAPATAATPSADATAPPAPAAAPGVK